MPWTIYKKRTGVKGVRDWGDAQSVKRLSCKHMDQSQVPEPEFKAGVMVQVLTIPALGRQRQADAWGLLASWPSLLAEFLVNERTCLKRKRLVSSA